jgi:phenylalanine-4-hydroxylase
MLRADSHPPGMRADYTFDFDPAQYQPDNHAFWHELCERQMPILKNRACEAYMEALDKLSIVTSGGIPDWRRLSDYLEKTTRWRIVIVPGLIPGNIFREHLSKRQFPVTWWIRDRSEIDYLQEPDIFHDLFGHVPLLANPIFADYMQQFGLGAVKAETLGAGTYIGRLYWYTVEFGLIREKGNLRIFGSGIVSSAKESVYCLESPVPNRIGFNLMRIMQTDYIIDDVQKNYFVIDSFKQLFNETRPDFTDYYAKLKTLETIPPGTLVKGDEIITRGTL